MSFFMHGVPLDLPNQTKRLSLAPKTQHLADAEANDRKRLSALLSAKVPDTWPPQFVAAPGPEDGPGWENLYVLQVEKRDGQSVLVGIAGMRKWAPEKKTIQVGVAILQDYHGQGLGEEVVAALGRWGRSQSGIDTVVCDIPDDAIAAAKSLSRAGYSKAVVSPFDGFIRFELVRG